MREQPPFVREGPRVASPCSRERGDPPAPTARHFDKFPPLPAAPDTEE